MTAAPPLSGRPELVATIVVAAAGLGSVVPLLAWLYGLGAFHRWFLAVAVPALAVLVGAAALAPRRGWRRLQVALAAYRCGDRLLVLRAVPEHGAPVLELTEVTRQELRCRIGAFLLDERPLAAAARADTATTATPAAPGASSPWRATHRVPDVGMRSWAAPDPSAPELAGRLPSRSPNVAARGRAWWPRTGGRAGSTAAASPSARRAEAVLPGLESPHGALTEGEPVSRGCESRTAGGPGSEAVSRGCGVAEWWRTGRREERMRA